MKKILFILIILFAFSFKITAQDLYQIGTTIDLFKANKRIKGEHNNVLTEKDIKGSPYLNDEFITGSVFTTTKVQYNNIKLRYNIFNDEIEFDADGQVQALLAPESFDMIEFGGNVFCYIPYSLLKKIKRGYFIRLVEGKASLWMRPEISFVKATEPAPYKEAEPAKFVRKADSFFIRIGKEEARPVSSKSDLIDIFPDQNDKIEAFVKKNKIKPNNPDNLKELVHYYNSL